MKKLFLFLLFSLLCASGLSAVSFSSVTSVKAEEEPPVAIYHDDDEDVDYKETKALVDYAGRNTPLDYPAVFSTDVFFKPSTTYSHFLAKQSIGLALSAFHLFDDTEMTDRYHEGTLIDYFINNGFQDFRIDDYFKETSVYTVGTAVGHVDIEKDGEKASLICVAVRGGNYKNEWQSNLSVYSDFRHAGFAEAATLVVDRVISYYGQHSFQHPVKVWVAGFSRAGAIANLVAADLNDSVVFSKEQVYAYTFAAPRAAWLDDPNGNFVDGYENIFNVVGASDFIPQFVPGEWQYYRYGVDLELPGSEFDSEFTRKYKVIQDELKKVDITTYYNPQLNLRVRMFYGLLLEIAKDDYEFSKILQPVLLKILQNKKTDNIVLVLRETLIEWKRDFPEISSKIDGVIDFALETIIPLITGGSYTTGQLPSSKSAPFRLAHEHFPELYLYFLYSFKADELFNTVKEFAYVTFAGGTLVLKEGASKTEVMRVKNGQKTNTQYAIDQGIDIPVWTEKGKTMFALPYDRDYELSYELSGNEGISARILRYDRVFSSHLGTLAVEASGTNSPSGVLLTINNRSASYCSALEETNPTEYVHYLGIQSGVLPFRAFVMLVGLIPGILIAGLIWLFVFLQSRIAKVRIHPLRLSLLSLFTILTILGEISFWFFSDMVIAGVLFKLFAALCILALYLIGKKKEFYKRIDKTILPFLVLALTGNILLSVIFPVGAGFLIAAMAYLCFYYLRAKRLRSHQWFLFAIVAVLLAGLLLFLLPMPLDASGIIVLIALAVALLACFSAALHGGAKEVSGFTMLLATILLGLYLHSSFALICSILYVIVFAVSMAIYIVYFDLPDNEPEILPKTPVEGEAKGSSVGA